MITARRENINFFAFEEIFFKFILKKHIYFFDIKTIFNDLVFEPKYTLLREIKVSYPDRLYQDQIHKLMDSDIFFRQFRWKTQTLITRALDYRCTTVTVIWVTLVINVIMVWDDDVTKMVGVVQQWPNASFNKTKELLYISIFFTFTHNRIKYFKCFFFILVLCGFVLILKLKEGYEVGKKTGTEKVRCDKCGQVRHLRKMSECRE